MKYRIAGASYRTIAEKLTEDRAQAYADEHGVSFERAMRKIPHVSKRTVWDDVTAELEELRSKTQMQRGDLMALENARLDQVLSKALSLFANGSVPAGRLAIATMGRRCVAGSFSIAIRERVKSSRVRSRRATAICRGPTLRRSARRRGICISAGTCGHPCTAARRRDRGHSRHSAASRSTTRSRSARIVAMWASWPTTPSTATTTPSIRALSPTIDLAELARALPAHWRRPSKPADLATAPGRNCALFAALCKLALGGSDEGLLTWARTLNREFSAPLADAEVRGVWRSVCRYRARWRVQGHQQGWLWKQAARGSKGGLIGGRKGGMASGVVRRAWTPLEHDRAPWESAGRETEVQRSDLMALENARLDQYAGIGLIAGGVLLATLWADTPVAESLTFTPLRGGGSLGASFGF